MLLPIYHSPRARCTTERHKSEDSANHKNRTLSDTWADTKQCFPGDACCGGPGDNLHGAFRQLYLLKKANRHLKVLLSVGGWTYSANFSGPASLTDVGRSKFASTAVSLVKNLGLDGLDIDWEFPQNETEAANMVLLLKSTRDALDAYGNSLSPPYHLQLTVACPAGRSNYQTLHLAEMDPYIDFWFLMAYNYVVDGSSVAGNQANLFPSTKDPASTPINTKDVISDYIASGATTAKIVLGMPLFGQSFAATEGLGKPYIGVGSGTWEAGIYDFKTLPLAGAKENTDPNTGSCYSYDATSREFISYDNVPVAKQKAAFIQQMKLGGAVWWESSADKVGSESLIQNVAEILGGSDGSGLECSQNQLSYPDSSYENLRAGIPGDECISVAARSSAVVEDSTSVPTASGTSVVSSHVVETQSMASAVVTSSNSLTASSGPQTHSPVSAMTTDSSAVSVGSALSDTKSGVVAGESSNVPTAGEIDRPSCVLANPRGLC